MRTTDFPVRANSERNDFNREDSKSSNEAYKSFTKDRRARNNGGEGREALFSTTNRRNQQGGEQQSERRHSYNPNFTRDNRLTDFNRNNNGYSRSEGGYGQRERNFNREGGYNRQERSFNKEERSFNREERGGFNREERGFNRERNFNREGGYNREGGFNRERNYNREERGFNKEERNFNREDRGFNGGERKPFDRKPYGEHKSFGECKQFSDRKPFGERKQFDRKPRFDKKEPRAMVNTANHYTLENYPSYDAPKQSEAIRLNRYISMSGICSRREADEYITSGAITVNGEVVTELGSKVMPGDVVCYNGKQIQNEKKVYIVMNKPKGFVTTLDDPHADKSVMDLVKNACTERIYPVGRLDKNSVGVLLLTNDGDLAKKLTHPTYEKKKIYQVSLDKRLERGDMERLIMGITLEDGEIAADDICYVEDPKMKNAVGIEIHSGRNRIVRRMFEHVGYRVGKLDRVYFAGLTKQKLKRGEWRFLTDKEVGLLKSGNYE
ncbi:MAG: RNA-binding S4 domain-containing protein [Tidjanibacter sp.]|nr:RNA-binding S4 domain-containing protein [Tidjanibacter sp.]